LLGYDPGWGSFVLALATAFETGRALAVADSVFAQQLTTFKRAARAGWGAPVGQADQYAIPRPGRRIRRTLCGDERTPRCEKCSRRW
ncbi:hypothetical protein, partial [Nocardia abscessus]|uniref:hypothetical protein n=1 Tax=Nocardia abscessus TaxID=120957 RepID=UPI002453BF04